jgi:surface protein
MKKILFLLLLFIPFSVFAKDTCDPSNIEIQSIQLENSIGNIEEVSNASVSNQKINLGLKMNVLGDAAEYKLVLKNHSKEDYYFDEESLNLDRDFVHYEIIFGDNTNLIRGGEEKTITLKVSYKEKLDASLYDDGVYNGSQVVQLNMSNVVNPFTGRFLGLFVFICLVIGFFVLYKDKRKIACFLLLLSFLIPFTVNAVCKHSLEVNANLVVDVKDTVFLPGKEVNVKMKLLAGDNATSYSFKNTLVTSFQYSSVEPMDSNKEEKNIVSIPESGYPIYMWYEDGVIYWWSEDKTPSLNEDASYMFYNFRLLKDISGISSFYITNTKSLAVFLAFAAIENLDCLSKWNISSVTDLSSLFLNNMSLTDASGIKNWDVSNVEMMYMLFACCFELEEIDLSNWSTPSLTNMAYMFASMYYSQNYSLISKLKKIHLSEKFDTSKVTDMSRLFYNDRFIEDYSFLQLFDTSSVINMYGLLQSNHNFNDLKYIKDWDVSKVTDFGLFITNSKVLTSLSGLENWDVSSATSMYRMFFSITTLEDASAINDWDVTNVTNFEDMFWNVPVLPNFTKVEGTWNRGTFTPSNG